jgi:hypothetical protein
MDAAGRHIRTKINCRKGIHPPFGRVDGEERAVGEGQPLVRRTRIAHPGNSLALVSDPPGGRVKTEP